ncbi:MAG: hypothetical protein IKC49_03535, partial [Clostridia bacterium]|nr:hypothetical protein [Clostridia bacterium]
MREIALAAGVENKEIIDYLYTNVKSKIDFCKTIITNYSDSNFSYLLFACEDTYIDPCESILKDIIVEYIESVYKVDYLKKRIKNPLNETLTFDAYIKVLSIFDKATDISALANIIILNETFFIDSF